MKSILLGLSLLCFGVVHAQAEEVFPFVAKVNVKTANLRAGQNKNFESLAQLKSGDELVVVGASFDWRKVKLPLEAKAYINAGFVKDLGRGVFEVTGNRLNIRAAAVLNSSIIGQLKKGDLVRVLEKKEDWLLIEPPDESFGWIAKEFIDFYSKEIPPARLVKAPVRNLEVKKAAFPDLPTRSVVAIGYVDNLKGVAVSPDIRHSLNHDGRTYALQGYRHIIDGFLNQKVKIEGQLQPDIKSDFPVVKVTKITLVL